MRRRPSKGSAPEVWFERIERAVHRVQQRNRSLTASEALSEALGEDDVARALYARYCARGRHATATVMEGRQDTHQPRVSARAPGSDGSAGGVLLEVARLRSLRSGTDYADEIEAVLRDYPNLAHLYRGGRGFKP